jgi:hypothetical protein
LAKFQRTPYPFRLHMRSNVELNVLLAKQDLSVSAPDSYPWNVPCQNRALFQAEPLADLFRCQQQCHRARAPVFPRADSSRVPPVRESVSPLDPNEQSCSARHPMSFASCDWLSPSLLIRYFDGRNQSNPDSSSPLSTLNPLANDHHKCRTGFVDRRHDESPRGSHRQ